MHGQMSCEISELQPAVSRHLEQGIIQACSQLFDTRCFPATGRAKDVQGFLRGKQPDDDVPAGFMEQVIGVQPGGIQRGGGISFDGSTGRIAAKNLASIQFDDLKPAQFVRYGLHRHLLEIQKGP